MIPTNFGDTVGTVRDRVGAAIQRAAQRTSVDFSYLLNQAKVESGLNPTAKARTSSATGLFQFIEQTWLGTVKKHGAAHGLGWAADSIQCGPDGRYRVADPNARRTILDLRSDPDAASTMAAEFARDNQATLEAKLGRPVGSVDLYLAHFLGAAGASDFLRAHDADPDAPAAELMPAAARANRWVFFNRDGTPCSLSEIRNRFAAKIDGSASLPPPMPSSRADELQPGEFLPIRTASAIPTAARPLPSPQYARLAYLMLAELGA